MGSLLARLRARMAVSCAALLVSAAPLAAAGDVLASSVPLLLAQSAGCAPDWIATFSAPELNDEILALTVFDDGSGGGPALYAGGRFTTVGGKHANRIAKWDGHTWSALGTGMDETVHALTVFDDGSGPELYAGGTFGVAGGEQVHRVAKWDGASWSALGSGVNLTVYALTAFDDGSGAGPALYAGGNFTTAGDLSASKVAKWDGQSWSALSSGVNNRVHALAVHDGGSGAGPALYAGGYFTAAGGQGANFIARWDGQAWSALGGGFSAPVLSLAVFDDGTGGGPALHAGTGEVAKWDGQGWSSLGSGMNDAVRALTVFDDGSGAGPALYAAGDFTSADGMDANRIAKWDGASWSALGSAFGSGPGSAAFDTVAALAAFDGGSGAGPALYAGGGFAVSPGVEGHLAVWGCPLIDRLPGCFGNTAVLTVLAREASLGSTLALSLSSTQLATGLGLLYMGFAGTDAAGCGPVAPGIGELLLGLVPVPLQVGAGDLGAGTVGFALPVPDAPSLVGLQVAFQGAAVGVFDPGVSLQLSNALLATLTR